MKSLDALLSPRRIAVVGASANPKSIGGQPVSILREAGFKGTVYPVNPRYTELNGERCYPDLLSLPERCDMAVVAVNADLVGGVIEQCAAAGIPFATVFSSGFREIGPAGVDKEIQLKQIVAKTGVRIIGPNCIGTMNLKDRVFCGFGPGFRNYALQPGPVAFVSQSGGFAFSIVTLAHAEGVGFNYVVSGGNEADLSTLDFIADFLERDDVKVVVTYIEGVADGKRLRELGRRALALGKPILVWKVGNTAMGRVAAQSHTASMTADYTLYRAAFREGGFVEIEDLHDMIDCVRAFTGKYLPKGPNLAAITTSGGSGVMMVDVADRYGMKVPPLTDSTITALKQFAPAFASLVNPIDATAQLSGNYTDFNRMADIVLGDPNVDQLILRYGAVHGAGSEIWARGVADIQTRHGKPLFVCWNRVPDRSAESLQLVEREGVPWALTPVRVAHAAGQLYQFTQRREAFLARGAAAHARITQRAALDAAPGEHVLSERRSKALLARYGIAVTREVALTEAAIAALKTAPLPFPLVVKVDTPDIAHKTEAGAVRLNINSLDELKAAAAEIIASARRYHAGAHIDGVLVAEMARGTEVIIGVINDAFFGPVVMFGLGGVFTELLKDVTYRYAPFDSATAQAMIRDIKTAPLLTGFRGKPALAVDKLAETLLRVSELIADHPDRIAEIDINPLFVNETDVVAADALVVLKN